MDKTKQIAGICSTCNHIDDCYHRLHDGMVIWFCEQFDDYVPQNPQTVNRFGASRVPTMSKAPTTPGNQEVVRGLCVNCEHRMVCVLARTPGGIWHCDEYH